jgi:hypothetical protein
MGGEMSKIVITINTDNAAFEDADQEVSCILKDLSEYEEIGLIPEGIMDINGNTCGTFKIKDGK